MSFTHIKNSMPCIENALPARDEAISIADSHFVIGNTLVEPFPAGLCRAVFLV